MDLYTLIKTQIVYSAFCYAISVSNNKIKFISCKYSNQILKFDYSTV